MERVRKRKLIFITIHKDILTVSFPQYPYLFHSLKKDSLRFIFSSNGLIKKEKKKLSPQVLLIVFRNCIFIYSQQSSSFNDLLITVWIAVCLNAFTSNFIRCSFDSRRQRKVSTLCVQQKKQILFFKKNWEHSISIANGNENSTKFSTVEQWRWFSLYSSTNWTR